MPLKVKKVLWDVQTVPIPNQVNYGWGIAVELLFAAIEILNNDQHAEEVNEIMSFKQFARLVVILRQAGAEFTDINDALRFWISQSKENEVRLNKEIQTCLKSFGCSGRLIVDGIAGPRTKSLLADILGVFHISPSKIKTSMTELISRLAQHVIRIKTNESKLLDNDSGSLLTLFVNDNSASFEFRTNPFPGLYFAGEDILLADFSKEAKWQDAFREFDFLQWLMFFQFPDVNRPMSVSPVISLDGQKWQPMRNENSSQITEQAFKPNQYLDVTGRDLLKLRFNVAVINPRAIFCILLKEDFSHISVPVIPFKFNERWIYEAQIDLANKIKIPKVRNGAYYLKVFILDNLDADYSIPKDSEKSSDGSVDEPFYLLMKADPLAIDQVITLGLFNQKNSPAYFQPFRDQWILVAGTGTYQIPDDQRFIAEALGRALAVAGYGLICGGWPGVDEAVARCFRDTLTANGNSDKDRLIQIINTGQRPIYDYGTVEQVTNDWYNQVSKRVSAFIMIGGEGGTYDTYLAALNRDIPVIPVMTTGGDAARAFEELKDVSAGNHIDFFPESFFNELVNEANAPAKAELIVKVIGQALKLKRPELRELAAEMDKQRPVIYPDDLQKGRWGGLAINNGIALSALIGKPDKENNYAVKLTVTFADKRNSAEEVAFFLHNTFEKKIRFVKVKDGKAILNIRAYEAFTVGALTEGGFTLELDLNTAQGEPAGFYYPEINEDFRKKVGQLYQQAPVKVADDLQKGRWGGQASHSRKKLSATVTKTSSANAYTVVAEISGEPERAFSKDVAFFLHDTFEAEILFAKVRDGKASVNIQAYEAFTIGACASGGELLELDLQQQPGFPNGFYYTNGNFSFYKEREILNLVAADQKRSNLVIKKYKALLLFETNEQHTWLVVAQDQCYIILDDMDTRKHKIAVQVRFKTADLMPIDTREKDGRHSVKFTGEENRWLFSPHLFTRKSLVKRVTELLDA